MCSLYKWLSLFDRPINFTHIPRHMIKEAGSIIGCSHKDAVYFLRDIGMLNLVHTMDKNGFMQEYFERSELGEKVFRFVRDINTQYYMERRQLTMSGDKYTRMDYEELYESPYEVKILRTQKALLKCLLSNRVRIRDAGFSCITDKDNSNENSHNLAVMVLDDLVQRTRKELPPGHTDEGLPLKGLSAVTIEEFPAVFNEWSVAGCYNEAAAVNYPLALWKETEIKRYYAAYIKKS